MRPRRLGKKKDASLSLLVFSCRGPPCLTMRSFCRPAEPLLFDIDLERLGRGPSADDEVAVCLSIDCCEDGSPFLSLREIGLVMLAISGAEPHAAAELAPSFKAGEVAGTVEAGASGEGKAGTSTERSWLLVHTSVER